MNQWTTSAPSIDLAAEFPELAPYARTTTRLHPRRGEPGVFDSSVGGRPLWPAGEAWPIRPGSDFGPYDEERIPALPLLQLYRRDVDQLPVPEGTDLLQVLWYPVPHETAGEWEPQAMLFWRDSASVTDVLAEVPLVNPDYPDYAPFPEYVPTPCVLHPNRTSSSIRQEVPICQTAGIGLACRNSRLHPARTLLPPCSSPRGSRWAGGPTSSRSRSGRTVRAVRYGWSTC